MAEWEDKLQKMQMMKDDNALETVENVGAKIGPFEITNSDDEVSTVKEVFLSYNETEMEHQSCCIDKSGKTEDNIFTESLITHDSQGRTCLPNMFWVNKDCILNSDNENNIEKTEQEDVVTADKEDIIKKHEDRINIETQRELLKDNNHHENKPCTKDIKRRIENEVGEIEMCSPIKKYKLDRNEGWQFVDTAKNITAFLPPEKSYHDDFGLNPKFLESLRLKLPLKKVILVEELPEKISDGKVFEIFSMAGEIRRFERLKQKKQVRIVYDHPVEAVQAISMFNKYKLFDKIMHVTMETLSSKTPLPAGLYLLGVGFGKSHRPLQHVGTVMDLRDTQEILCEMGRLKKKVPRIKKNPSFPFLFYYKRTSNDSLKKTDTFSSDEDFVENKKARPDIENVIKYSVPGTGDCNPNVTSTNALKEIDAILKEEGLIPEDVESRSVRDILNALQNRTDVSSSSRKQSTEETSKNQYELIEETIDLTIDDSPAVSQFSVGSDSKSAQQNNSRSRSISQKKLFPQAPHQYSPFQNPHYQFDPRARNFARILPPGMHQPPMLRPPFVAPQHAYQNMNQQYRFQQSRIRNDNSIAPSPIVFQNLPQSVGKKRIFTKMKEIGDLISLRMGDGGRAYVQFRTAADADRCIRLFHRSQVDGQIIDVYYLY